MAGNIRLWATLASITQREWIERRARFFEKKLGIPKDDFIKNAEEQNRSLDALPRDSEIVLWFEHDRFDQTMLMYLLNELSLKGFHQLSMVTINQYPGIENFYGLGQLTSQQLEGLFYTNKQPISQEQLDEAVTCWKAYTSNDPTDIEKWIASTSEKLPFLKQAMQSHLSNFPSLQTGLNEVESLALRYIQDKTCSFSDIYDYISKQRMNDSPSDWYFSAILTELKKGPYPLLESDVPLPNFLYPEPNAKLSLTKYGMDVLNGKINRFDLVESDWWLGGVFLKENHWYWDGQRLISVDQ